MEQNVLIWNRLADDLHLGQVLEDMYDEVTIEDLPIVFPKILSGQVRGRIIVKI